MVVESRIEDYLTHCLRAAGGEHRKVEWVGRIGAPDRLVGVPCVVRGSRIERPARHALVELKRPGLAAGFPADAHERTQAREHARLREIGFDVFVIDSEAGVDSLMGWLLR